MASFFPICCSSSISNTTDDAKSSNLDLLFGLPHFLTRLFCEFLLNPVTYLIAIFSNSSSNRLISSWSEDSFSEIANKSYIQRVYYLPFMKSDLLMGPPHAVVYIFPRQESNRYFADWI